MSDRSWGTREKSTGEDKGLRGWSKYFGIAWDKMLLLFHSIKCCCKKESEEQEKDEPKEETKNSMPALEEENMSIYSGFSNDVTLTMNDSKNQYIYEETTPLDKDVMEWLQENKSEVRISYSTRFCCELTLWLNWYTLLNHMCAMMW